MAGAYLVPDFLLRCLECDDTVEVPVLVLQNFDDLTRLLMQSGWVVSVVSPPGAGFVTLAPICQKCRDRVHDPAVVV